MRRQPLKYGGMKLWGHTLILYPIFLRVSGRDLAAKSAVITASRGHATHQVHVDIPHLHGCPNQGALLSNLCLWWREECEYTVTKGICEPTYQIKV